MKPSFLLFLILFLNFWSRTGFAQNSDSTITILQAGFAPDFSVIQARDIVAKEWGLQFIPVAGCIVSDQLMDSIYKHNSISEKLIKKKFGNDWEESFQEEVEKQIQIVNRMNTLINRNELKESDSYLKVNDVQIEELTFQKINDTEYSAVFFVMAQYKGVRGFYSLCELEVDLSNNSVRIVSSEIKEMEMKQAFQ